MMVSLKVFLSVMLVLVYGNSWAGRQVVCASIGQWPPMEYLDKNGKMIGYTVDFMEAAARITGFTIEFREVAEKDIVANLQAGEYDAICSSMINEALHKEELDFSTPYFLTRQALVIHGKRKMVASRDRSAMQFGARKGTYGMETVRAMEVLPKEYNTISRAIEDVLITAIEGAVCDEPVASYYTQGKFKEGVKMVGLLANSPKKPLSVAVAKGNKELQKLLNKGISAVKVRGIDKELQRKWFNR